LIEEVNILDTALPKQQRSAGFFLEDSVRTFVHQNTLMNIDVATEEN
jgi:hypothetical protein